MKNRAIRKAPAPGAFWLTFLVLAAALSAHSQIIPTNVTINWTPGITVGVQGGIPVRTNIIDVTLAPYKADNTGTTDASSAINSAISAAQSNQVVYFPDGTYLLSNSIIFTKSYITLRGHTNSVLVGLGSGWPLLKAGNDSQPGSSTAYPISSGSTKGSTVIKLTTAPSTFRGGDQINVSETTTTIGSATFPVISAHQYNYTIAQQCKVIGVSGTTVTLSAPLVFDFTNAPEAFDCGIYSTIGVGIENLTITDVNPATQQTGNYGVLLLISMCHDCWVTNCSILWPANYGLYLTSSSHILAAHNRIQHALSAGSNHSGLLADSSSECLIEDNIISDGLEPGIEFNYGFSGNAIFANFFTNNVAFDILCHNTHPVMNLWEENVCAAYFEMDGYFGSQSHQTLFRNAIESPSIPLMLKRWVSYMNIVGNVLGSTGGNYSSYSATNNNPSQGMIIEFGYPNIGNNGYNGLFSPPLPWNYPGANYLDGNGNLQANGIWTFTNTQVKTTNLIGVFTNIPAPVAGVYSLVFQDNINTNVYYPTNGVPIWPAAAGTSSNLLINVPITVSNGWRVFISGQGGYQQLQLSQSTHLITGNYDYYNKAVMWNSNGAQTIPVSLLYTNGPPSYWGSNSWPAIDPNAATKVTMIPAEESYLGIGVIPVSPGTPPPTNQGIAAPTGLHIVAAIVPPTSTNGGSGGYSPATDGNVFEWLKADAISQGNNTPVSTWTASTGVNVANPNSGATQPTFQTSQQNGLPAVAFSGANSTYLATSANFTSQSQPFTIFIVFKDGDGSSFSIPIGPMGGGSDFRWIHESYGVYDLLAGNSGTGSPAPGTDSNWHILMLVYSNSSSKWQMDNGPVTSFGGGPIGTNLINSLCLGAYQTSVGNATINMGELIFYSGDQSGNAAAIFGYLDGRWAVY